MFTFLSCYAPRSLPLLLPHLPARPNEGQLNLVGPRRRAHTPTSPISSTSGRARWVQTTVELLVSAADPRRPFQFHLRVFGSAWMEMKQGAEVRTGGLDEM